MTLQSSLGQKYMLLQRLGYICRYMGTLSPQICVFMLCLVGVNDSGRIGMKNELYYWQLLTNFILSSILFLTLCARDHIFNFRWNALFSHTLNFFSNLIIAILHSLKFISKLPSYLYQFQVILLIPFHSPQPNTT